MGMTHFSDHNYTRFDNDYNVMRQSACLVFNPITANDYAFGGSGVRLYGDPDTRVGWDQSFVVFCLAHRDFTGDNILL